MPELGETFADTIVREVREETGLTVTVSELAHLRSGYKLRAEVAYEALCTGGELRLSSLEILDARWFPPDALPAARPAAPTTPSSAATHPLALLRGTMQLPLAPNEHLAGTPEQRRDLLAYLTMVRAGPPVSQLPRTVLHHPRPLLTAPPPFLDEAVLHAGLTPPRRYRRARPDQPPASRPHLDRHRIRLIPPRSAASTTRARATGTGR